MPLKKVVSDQRSAISRRGKRRRVEEEKGSERDSASLFSRPAVAPTPRSVSSKRASSKRGAASGRSTTPRRQSVVIVGAGRLGTALARALAACGYDVRALVARSDASARRGAARACVKARALGVARLEELPPSDFLFISTPDDAIEETAQRVAALPDARARIALHTSGALSSEVLTPLRARGYAVGSMHPLVAVTEAEAGAESLSRAFYCVEGDARAVRAARRLVRDLGGRSFSISAGDKALYHAAALIAAGHAVALFDTAAGLLARCGLSDGEARRVLLPLLASTLENLSRSPPERALTGTFARGDASTVRKHLAALGGSGDAEALLVYALLGARSLRLAARRGVADASALKEIAMLLASATVNRAQDPEPSAGK
ncbi:MAG TPA: Rossmann-like and DUF2520 domain-containing protein [Pyrinomonadaceae bacterium]|nr:Rossmann-like and DUF2520 domain-containing protein [Pyrinomonadaceae bacterium]